MASYKWPYWPSLMSYYPDFLWLTRVFLGGHKNPIQGPGVRIILVGFFQNSFLEAIGGKTNFEKKPENEGLNPEP